MSEENLEIVRRLSERWARDEFGFASVDRPEALDTAGLAEA